MYQKLRKAAATVISLCIWVSSAGIVLAEDNYSAVINSVAVSDSGKISSADITVNRSGDYIAYVAVYDNGVLNGVESASVSGGGTVLFDNELSFDENTQTLKCFVWDSDMKPAAQMYLNGVEPPVAQVKYKATFNADAHAKILVSDTQNIENAVEATEAYARNSETGEIDSTGNGQVNFKVVVDEGYEVDSVTAEPSANYKNLKLPSELGENTYRITKITGDITVTVTTKEASSESGGETELTGGGAIHLLGTSIDVSEANCVSVDGTVAIITSAGTYNIDGTLEDGQIVVMSKSEDDEIIINLNGVNITSATGNTIDGQLGNIRVVPGVGTDNTIKTTADGKAGIYNKNDLDIKGTQQDGTDGTINVISTTGKGIQSKKDIEIGAGTVNVSSLDDGIKGNKSVTITKKNNNVTVTTTGDGDGIKSDKAPSVDSVTGEVTGGTVSIKGGNVNVTTGSVTTDGVVTTGDGIQADMLLEITGGTLNINAAGEALKANASSIADGTVADGDGCVLISGGTITASAGEDGIKAVKNVTINGGSTTITKAEEGIQVNEVIYTDDTETTVSAYVEGTINITDGTVNITSSEDGIQCGTGDIEIAGGDITVNSQLDGIQAEYMLNIGGGTFNVTTHGGTSGSSTEDSCKGLKAGQLIYITDGTFNINSYDDAIHSNHTVRIKGGNITAASNDDGVHGDCYLFISDSADINVTTSYEGIEAAKIYIQGGITRVVSSDDGANAAGDEPSDSPYDISEVSTTSVENVYLMAGGGWNQGPNQGGEDSSNYGYLEVSGGILYIEAEGDGFDSNGDGLISGGTVIVNGPTSGGNGVFDVGDNGNTLKITGGTVIGAGTSDMAVTPTASTDSQYYVVTSSSSSSGGPGGWGGQQDSSSTSGFSSQAAGKAFKLTDSSGNEVVTYVPAKTYAWVLVSTPDMTSGSYTLNYGGSVTGGTWCGSLTGNYGLVTGGTYSGSSSITLTAKQ